MKPKVYQWKGLNFGDKPTPNIAAGAIITLAKASQDQYPEAAKELRTHVYVDDIGGSRENEDKSKQITSEIDAILSKGQFQIKQWHSNNKKVDQKDEEHVDFLRHHYFKENRNCCRGEACYKEKLPRLPGPGLGSHRPRDANNQRGEN